MLGVLPRAEIAEPFQGSFAETALKGRNISARSNTPGVYGAEHTQNRPAPSFGDTIVTLAETPGLLRWSYYADSEGVTMVTREETRPLLELRDTRYSD